MMQPPIKHIFNFANITVMFYQGDSEMIIKLKAENCFKNLIIWFIINTLILNY